MAYRNGSTGSRGGRVNALLDRLASASADSERERPEWCRVNALLDRLASALGGIRPERSAALGDYLDAQEATGESNGTGIRITFGNATANHQGAGLDGLCGGETGGDSKARSSSTVPEK